MKKILKVALVGNPNCGKSSLFNSLTGLRQKVGNFAGVTVEKKTGFASLSKEVTAEIIDLPGTYSLYPKRIDEFITYDVLINPLNDSHPDLVIIVADASNLKRNLLLCSQIIDLKLPVIMGLNMLDVAKTNGVTIDTAELSVLLGVKVVNINARNGIGIENLKKTIQEVLPVPKEDFIPVHDLAPAVIDEINEIDGVRGNYHSFQIANHYMNIFCLDAAQKEKIKSINERHQFSPAKQQAAEIIQRYDKINKILERTVKEEHAEQKLMERTSKIDRILIHPVFGYLIFVVIFFLVFQAIFTWAVYPMNMIDLAFSSIGNWLSATLPKSAAVDLITQGVLPGIGGVIVFIPQIMMLFGFISLLEDTGYMARVSFLMDRLMRKVGLNGKSSVPLMSGLACAIPAIMSTRNIENWKDRIITILVTPLMSCSARLPVYTLLIGFAVPDKSVLGIFNLKGFVMLGLYLLGFIMALVAAFIMKLIIKGKEKGYFMMELPIYRMPRWKNVGLTMIEKAKLFVFDAGKIIVAISIVLWFLASYGPKNEMESVNTKYSKLQTDQINSDTQQSERLTHSYAGHIGKFIEPVIRPLGFDWKIGIALITSFAAREVFVGTMSTIYSVGSADKEPDFQQIRDKMRTEINPDTGEKVYSTATVFSLMIFFAFAMQCMSTVAIVKRETNSWKWPVIQVAYMTALAYVASLIVYQTMK